MDEVKDNVRLPMLLTESVFKVVVIDEAHQARNPKSNLHKGLKRITADSWINISATPIQNKTKEVGPRIPPDSSPRDVAADMRALPALAPLALTAPRWRIPQRFSGPGS